LQFTTFITCEALNRQLSKMHRVRRTPIYVLEIKLILILFSAIDKHKYRLSLLFCQLTSINWSSGRSRDIFIHSRWNGRLLQLISHVSAFRSRNAMKNILACVICTHTHAHITHI